MWDNTGTKCERCGFPTAQAFDYIDRHGDISPLCATCYHAALHPAESPDLFKHAYLMAWLCLAGLIGTLILLAVRP